jgi:hypothetical protein
VKRTLVSIFMSVKTYDSTFLTATESDKCFLCECLVQAQV